MSRIHLQSPAKVNLFLKVVNKRPDGFHNIITVFERISLADDIYMQRLKEERIVIECDHPHVPTGAKNLVHKVFRLMKEELGLSGGIKIKIKKRIPVAAGLAGGSSNAATVIKGINKLWNCRLPKEKLLHFARAIGSDVAFFIHDYRYAKGTKRGDVIRKLNIKANLWHILVIPKIKVYAKDVYKRYRPLKTGSQTLPSEQLKAKSRGAKVSKGVGENMLTKPNDSANILIHNLKNSNISKVGQLLENDLERPVIQICPQLLTLKKKLKLLDTQGVMISGSGPSVFGLVASQTQANALKKILSKKYAQVFAVRTF